MVYSPTRSHTGLRSESADDPLVDVLWCFNRTRVSGLDERLADYIDGELFRREDVSRVSFGRRLLRISETLSSGGSCETWVFTSQIVGSMLAAEDSHQVEVAVS